MWAIQSACTISTHLYGRRHGVLLWQPVVDAFHPRSTTKLVLKSPPAPPDLLTLLRFKGPNFKIKLELQNQGDRALTNLPVAFTYDRDIYAMENGQFMVSALIPVSLRLNE